MKLAPASLLSLLFLAGIASFVLGGLAALSDHPIWARLETAKKAATSYMDTGQVLAPLSYFERSPDAATQRYTVENPAEITPGFLAITRLDPARNAYVTDLIDTKGRVLHTWKINYHRITGKGSKSTFPHGVRPLPDGALLVNFDLARALARIDQCGATQWARTDGIYHHEIATSGDEIWTWFGPGGRVYDGNELVRFDPATGDLLERIHLVDDIILASERNRIEMSIGADHTFNRDARLGNGQDDFHPNDAVPLPADLAAAFAQFEAGDLLISLRNLNMIAVVDRETFALKWHRNGPWIWQHDPDWHADGTISIFGNNPARGRSQIYVVDPQTDTVSAPLEHGAPFFTDIMGSHQRLPSGNWLVVANRTGRALELSPQGEIIREYHNIINDRFSAIIVRAEWLPPDYFDTLPSC